MKQVVLSYRTGALSVDDVPPPVVRRGCVLVRTVRSVVSAGTERLVTDLARKSIVGKALARPDQVRRVIAKARSDGVAEAYQQAVNRLDSPVALGYSSSGVVVGVADDVRGFRVGDRVACAGDGYASHAEIVCVPANLCTPVPSDVDFEPAAFSMLGAIALHAVRTSGAALGERIAVIGLGLLGQITVQLLVSSGSRVFGVDISKARVDLAARLGMHAGATTAQNVSEALHAFTAGTGADAVIITAATSSNEPTLLAADLCRPRGRIVAVGAIRLDVPRDVFFSKELTLVVSRASGPGAKDAAYAGRNVDFPVEYVRWTQERNVEQFLQLLSDGSVDVAPLVTHRFPIERAGGAYELLDDAREPSMAIVLTYPTDWPSAGPSVDVGPRRAASPARTGTVRVGLIGAGLFAKTTLLPALRGVRGVELGTVASATGLTARHLAKKFGFAGATGDYREILADETISGVIIATRHDLHAQLTVEALRAGKHVLVEKPLALDDDELGAIVDAHATAGRFLLVGFNRRFAPFAVEALRRLGAHPGPRIVHITVNAGYVEPDSWVHDPREGGGRILGEVCHFVDFVHFLTGSTSVEVYAQPMSGDGRFRPDDNLQVSMRLANGSIGTITYAASGDRAYPRERVEVFAGGVVCAIDNFKRLTVAADGRTHRSRSLRLDRGYRAELEAFASAVRNDGRGPVDFLESVRSTTATFRVLDSFRQGRPVLLTPDGRDT